MGWHGPYKERKYAVSQRLLTLRTKAKLTQVELATLVGVNRRSIQNWETGAAYPKESRLQQLIAVFLAHAVFTPGGEQAEATSLWELVHQDAPHALASFDEMWFTQLLAGQGRQQPLVDVLLPSPQPPRSLLMDWGEAIDVPVLYGRDEELATLYQWVLADRCRVVALLGLGGIGKTSLAIRFARQAASSFDAVLFRSLRNAPPLGPLLDSLIRTASAQQATPPESISDKIILLIELFRARHCLFILDNLEAILQAGAPTGDYRAGYADYGLFMQRLGESAHQSCLLLTSREKPIELGPLEGRTAPVRTLMITGLTESACQTILHEKDIYAATADCAALAQLYGGNPLALKLISEPIHEVFGGDVAAFLARGDAFFNGVGKLLDQQFSRSAAIEQAVLYWLAIERDLVALDALLTDLKTLAVQREVLAALESLRRRLLIERGASQPAFTLQPVIMEYMTDLLVERVCRELINGQPTLLRSHALVQATARDYVRRTQERLIVTPLLEQLVTTVGDAATAEQRLLAQLTAWRGQPPAEQGYGPGNVVNLLRLLRGDLRRLDLSNLSMRQLYLQGIEAQDTSLVSAHLSESVLAGDFDYSVCVALSADGAYLLAGTSNGEVRLWRVADRTPLLSMQAHNGGIYGLALSADRQLLATGCLDGTVKLWTPEKGVCLAVLQGHTGPVHGVALSADGHLLASSSYDGTIVLWATEQRVRRGVLEGHTGGVRDMSISADGRLVVSGGFDGTLRLWATDSGTCLGVLLAHDGGVWSVALSADGRLLASSGLDGSIRLWAVDTQQPLATLRGHTDMVWSMALSSIGRLLVSGSYDGTVRLWETSNSGCLAVLQGHTGGVRGVALSKDEQLIASGSFDGTIRLWEVNGGRHLATLQGQTGLVYGIALSSDGRLLASGGLDGVVRLWDTEHGQHLVTVQGHTGPIHGVALSGDGQVVATGGGDGTVRLWQTNDGQPLATLQGHTDMVWSVALSVDGRLLASGSFDGTVRLWDVESRTSLTVLQGHIGGVRGVALSGDGRLVASSGLDGTIRLWEVNSQRQLAILEGHTGLVWSVALSGDGGLVASSGTDGTVRLWDPANATCLAILEGHHGAVFRIALSADGHWVASSGMDGTVRMWRVADRAPILAVQAYMGAVWGMAFSNDGRLLASGERDGAVRLWDTISGGAVRLLRPDRAYERMDITGLTGVTKAQRTTLRALGAVENE